MYVHIHIYALVVHGVSQRESVQNGNNNVFDFFQIFFEMNHFYYVCMQMHVNPFLPQSRIIIVIKHTVIKYYLKYLYCFIFANC